jgi:hypothetical protein
MDSRTRERLPSTDAVEFVRFCYRRRAVGWPELYDEMCAVASRGHFRGWGIDELGEEGIGFSLFEMPALASLVSRIVAEEHERKQLARAILRESRTAATADALPAIDEPVLVGPDHEAEPSTEPVPTLRFAGAVAGA